MSISEDRALKQSPTGTSSTENRSNSDTIGPGNGRADGLQDFWEALRTERRRLVVRYVATHEDVTIGDVADRIAAHENDCNVDALESDQRKRVYIGLYQTHLGKLDQAGIIDWDKGRGTIDRGRRFVRTHAALEAFTDAAKDNATEGTSEDTGIVGSIKAALGGVA